MPAERRPGMDHEHSPWSPLPARTPVRCRNSGPMGAVLSPSLIGVDKAGHLPNASTFCGRGSGSDGLHGDLLHRPRGVRSACSHS